jgi:UDP-N-acetylglucosamine--N-acetylmuramyl-(pentapeptide) pyrophosphoryl-undecaprenol N-acetylglucosamine transferase
MEQKQKFSKKIVVTGGGSGGHVSVSSAVISALRERYNIPYSNLLYIGGDLGMEEEKNGESIEQKRFKDADFQTEYIRAGKLQRSFSLRGILLMFRTVLGFLDSFRIISKFKPDLVISTGGLCLFLYVYLHISRKSQFICMNRQQQLVSQTKLFLNLQKKIFVAFKESLPYFPEEKTFHTGNIVRKDIFKTNGKGEIVKPLKEMIVNQERYPILYISGGGQGSHILNMTVREILPVLLQDFQVILQTGDNQAYKDFDLAVQEKGKLSEEQQKRFLPVKYIYDEEIGFVLNNIDMYIGRSGANTTYEMGILKIPSIFIPIPWVTHNEQERNANILKDSGLAEILPEGESSREKLVLVIKRFWKEVISGSRNINWDELDKRFPKDAIDKIFYEIEELK